MNSRKQKFSARKALAAALVVTGCMSANAAQAFEGRAANNGPMTASGSINFRITIPAIMRITGLEQPDSVTIEPRHIAQGFIDLDSATSLRLTNNTRLGSTLAVAFDPTWVARVVVRAKGLEHEVAGANGTVQLTSGRSMNELVQLGFRLYLRAGAESGNYRWPVALTITSRAV
jgi:hypothetical protein